MKFTAVIVLLLISLPALAADKPFEHKFAAKPDQVYQASLAALEKLKWRIQIENKKGGLIMFNTGQLEMSGIARCAATIEEDGEGSTVQVAVNRKFAMGFAKNERVARKFFDALEKELAPQPVAAENK